jgi:hypothetical protein
MEIHDSIAYHKSFEVYRGRSLEVIDINELSQIWNVLTSIGFSSNEKRAFAILRKLLEEI